MPPDRVRFTEPWGRTALRTGGLALGIGAAVAVISGHRALWPAVTGVALWFTLGGHFVELLFRNQLARFVPGGPRGAAIARLLYWFVTGTVLYAGALATWHWAGGRAARLAWWVGGVGFVIAELLVHAAVHARGQPSFYEGRG